MLEMMLPCNCTGTITGQCFLGFGRTGITTGMSHSPFMTSMASHRGHTFYMHAVSHMHLSMPLNDLFCNRFWNYHDTSSDSLYWLVEPYIQWNISLNVDLLYCEAPIFRTTFYSFLFPLLCEDQDTLKVSALVCMYVCYSLSVAAETVGSKWKWTLKLKYIMINGTDPSFKYCVP